MSRRNWKRLQPSSLRHALELCKDFARERHSLSVERIAERMGLADHWTLYKWIQNGRMPICLVRAYEAVCGINYATRWLAASGGFLLIDMPTGRNASAEDIQVLQQTLNDAVGLLLQFHAGKGQEADTLAALQQGLEGLAWHHRNVEQYLQPELELNP
ncbi:hypothetical protein [Chromobacterium violaceum]|uniref:XRE family transcriptional regulator n=2 Tax=Chromobacterium violaceum TaxID=536 RepID=A0AAX2M926_CHRVL|nr:hypothetical protein [Chromobacterium violaceum]OLZ71822.1 hypothetical protein BS642_20940 [Chromobacterium violaceum]STB70527.1 Uncharacterised protein [Chromobacterium violaceum]SUX32654.1 Uncharacterised protein [Chromobacterium violaceum]